jgi:hypothetical protein
MACERRGLPSKKTTIVKCVRGLILRAPDETRRQNMVANGVSDERSGNEMSKAIKQAVPQVQNLAALK